MNNSLARSFFLLVVEFSFFSDVTSLAIVILAFCDELFGCLSLLKFHYYRVILVLCQDTQHPLVDIVNLVIVKYCPYIYDPEFKRLV